MIEHHLFPPYAITPQGRIFHGNVSLADHHLVTRDVAHTLFRVADLVATPIPTPLRQPPEAPPGLSRPHPTTGSWPTSAPR